MCPAPSLTPDGTLVIPRRVLLVLVFALPALIVTFAVVLGASQLARVLGDAAGARGLGWLAVLSLMLLAIDALLLLGALGVNAIGRDERL
ncbi:MAG: hypothetical protein WD872_10660 [Pirellulaceae bacterium]